MNRAPVDEAIRLAPAADPAPRDALGGAAARHARPSPIPTPSWRSRSPSAWSSPRSSGASSSGPDFGAYERSPTRSCSTRSAARSRRTCSSRGRRQSVSAGRVAGKVVVVTGAARGQGAAEAGAPAGRGRDGDRHRRRGGRRRHGAGRVAAGGLGRPSRTASAPSTVVSTAWSTTPASPSARGWPTSRSRTGTACSPST